MAEKMTRKQALENAIKVLATVEDEQFDFDANETSAILNKMIEQLSKPRAKAVSKVHLANVNLAKKIHEMVEGSITTKDVTNLGIPEIMTTQKAAAVLHLGVENGLFEKVVDKKKVSYLKIN